MRFFSLMQGHIFRGWKPLPPKKEYGILWEQYFVGAASSRETANTGKVELLR